MNHCCNLTMLQADVGHEIRFKTRWKFAGWLARQKFCFDLGVSFASPVLAVANLTGILFIGFRETLCNMTGLRPLLVLLLLIPTLFVGIILAIRLIGSVLDFIGFAHLYQHEQNQRNAMLKEAAGRKPCN